MFLLCALPSWETERNALARCSACSRSSGAAWPSTDARSMHKMKISLFIIICDHRCHGFFFNVTDVATTDDTDFFSMSRMSFSHRYFASLFSLPFGEGWGGAPSLFSLPLWGGPGWGFGVGLPLCSPSPFGEGRGGAPYPTVPSSETLSSFCASTANSMGSLLSTSRA